MRYKVGAEQVEHVPSLAHRPDGVFRVARTAPVGPTHAVDAATRRGRLRDQDRRAGRAGPRLGRSVLRREVPWLFRGRGRPELALVGRELAGQGPRWPDRPSQRHPGAEPDALKPDLIDQPPQQPQAPPASAPLMGVGLG